MTADARMRAPKWRPRVRRARADAAILLAIGIACGAGNAAHAEIGVTASVQSDDRYRGYTYSRGRPIATLDLAYDDAHGPYVGVSGTIVATTHDGLQPLELQEYIGISRRARRDLVWDVGIANYSFTRFFTSEERTTYQEYYVGLASGNFSSHIYYSPDYLNSGVRTLYFDLGAVRRIGERWRLNAHFGVRTPLNEVYGIDRLPPHYDLRLGAAFRIKPVELQLGVSTHGPRADYYDGQSQGHTALVAGATIAF